MMKRSNSSSINDEILAFLSLLVVQATYPKTYKSTTINSFENVVSISM
jgi:hypothetical protein